MQEHMPGSVWGPLSAIVGLLTFVVGLGLFFMVIIFPLSLLGDDDSTGLYTERPGQICAVAGELPWDGSDVKDVDVRAQVGVTDERTTNTFAREVLVCQAKRGLDHKATKYALKVLTLAPTQAVYVAFLLGTRRVMVRTNRGEPFGQDIAGLVQRLGWWLFGGLIIATLIQTAAESLLVGSMLKEQTWGWAYPNFPGAMILAALGVVGIGRALARAAELQADSDATI